MNRATIGATSFSGSGIGCPVSRASTSAYASRSRCTGAGNSTVSFTGLSSAMTPSLSFAIVMSLPFVRLEHEVSIDDDAHRETRPDRERRLHVEIALNDFLPGLIQAVARSEPERLNETPVV